MPISPALVRFHRERGALGDDRFARSRRVDQTASSCSASTGASPAFKRSPPKAPRSRSSRTPGSTCFEPAIFDRIPADTFYDFGKQVFPELLAGGLPFYGMQLQGAYWRDIGTPDEYRRATEDVLTGRVRIRGGARDRIPEGAQIANDARIEAPVRVGEGAQIGQRVRIAGPA